MRSGSYSSVSKRSTGQKSLPAHSGSAGRSSGSGHGSSGQRQFKKETAIMQRSPVKKRIKENKDHYIMADNYSSSRPVPEPTKNQEQPEPVSGATSGCPSVMTVTPVIRGSPQESSTPREETLA